MRKLFLLSFITFVAAILNTEKSSGSPLADRPEYFQIKVYHFIDSRQEGMIDTFLEKSLVPSLHASGMNNIGVFKSIANDTAADKRIYVFIPFKTLKQWEKYSKDAVDKINSDATSYTNVAYDKPAFARVETIFLRAFEDMTELAAPKLDAPKSERVYELRSYEGASEKIHQNKLQMFNQGGEIKLFKRLNFNGIFYGEVVFGSKMPNLMYMTSFNNMQARDEHWKTFGSDPEWKTLSGSKEYQNNVSHSDIVFLRPTSYSDL